MNQWYYGSQGQQNGPVTETELRHLIGQGLISRETLVWREGMQEWRKLSEVTELQAPPMVSTGQMGYPQNSMNYVPNSGLAIASMCCGIASIVFCYVNALPGIPAVVCGHLALKKIRESEYPMAGRGMAIAGLVTGYIGIMIQIATIVFFVIMFREIGSFSP